MWVFWAIEGVGLHVHGDEMLDLSLIYAPARLWIERQSDVDAVRSMIRSGKNCFMVVMRAESCFG